MDENRPIHQGPRIGHRLLGRQARLTRASGLRLGRAVAGRHERPEPVRAAMRLVPKKAGVARAAAPAPAPAPAEEQWVASPEQSTILPGVSDWGAEWMFGDADAAVAAGTPFMGAESAVRTPEEKRVARIKRGGPEVARAAKILEGDEQPPATPAPARVSRFPAEAPAATAAHTPAPQKRRVSRTPGKPPASTPAAAPSPPAVARTES